MKVAELLVQAPLALRGKSGPDTRMKVGAGLYSALALRACSKLRENSCSSTKEKFSANPLSSFSAFCSLDGDFACGLWVLLLQMPRAATLQRELHLD
jgi:hypothetical protein